jgi:serine O-acetyltransferase
MTQGLWASAEYRFGHWVRSDAPAWSRPLLVPVSAFTRLLAQILTGISLNPSATIGPGLYIGHFGGPIINGRVVMGAGCTLSPGVVIGQDVNPPFGAPRLGNGVYVAPGAKIFGDITIGDHVAIGANAVVRESLPDRAIAVGIPARVVRIQEPDEVRAAPVAEGL